MEKQAFEKAYAVYYHTTEKAALLSPWSKNTIFYAA